MLYREYANITQGPGIVHSLSFDISILWTCLIFFFNQYISKRYAVFWYKLATDRSHLTDFYFLRILFVFYFEILSSFARNQVFVICRQLDWTAPVSKMRLYVPLSMILNDSVTYFNWVKILTQRRKALPVYYLKVIGLICFAEWNFCRS